MCALARSAVSSNPACRKDAAEVTQRQRYALQPILLRLGCGEANKAGATEAQGGNESFEGVAATSDGGEVGLKLHARSGFKPRRHLGALRLLLADIGSH